MPGAYAAPLLGLGIHMAPVCSFFAETESAREEEGRRKIVAETFLGATNFISKAKLDRALSPRDAVLHYLRLGFDRKFERKKRLLHSRFDPRSS